MTEVAAATGVPSGMTSAIEVRGLSKQFGSVLAVDDLSFEVQAGRVTGFLGPNGSGKTTTLRMLLGLVSITSGVATFGGRRYVELDHPIHHVGAVLEATSFHPSRRAEDHLKSVAIGGGIPLARVDEALAQVGLTEVARRRVGKFSLGMRQRLQLATALLGDPEILILDEPSNGLDPQGIQWLRTFIRHQASIGHSVLVSSHLLSEMEETVDDVVIVSHGRLVMQTTLADLAGRAGTGTGLRIRSPELGRLAAVLTSIPVAYRPVSPDTLIIDGATPEWFGPLAAQHQIVLYELVNERGSLEDVFLSLTHGFDAGVPAVRAGGSGLPSPIAPGSPVPGTFRAPDSPAPDSPAPDGPAPDNPSGSGAPS
jgi:ABC-2 type transport system ATP-binding protein